MSVAKLVENQKEIVLPQLAGAFDTVPLQRTFTASESWNVYQSDVDASRVEQGGGVLSFTIPPAPAGKVMDLSRSHLKLTYFIKYAGDTGVTDNAGATHELATDTDMAATQPRLAPNRIFEVEGFKGSSQSKSYSKLAKTLAGSFGDPNHAPWPSATQLNVGDEIEVSVNGNERKFEVIYSDNAGGAAPGANTGVTGSLEPDWSSYSTAAATFGQVQDNGGQIVWQLKYNAYHDMIVEAIADDATGAQKSKLAVTGVGCRNRPIAVNGEIVSSHKDGVLMTNAQLHTAGANLYMSQVEANGVPTSVVYVNVRRGQGGTLPMLHSITVNEPDQRVAPAEEADLYHRGTPASTIVGWTDHIFESCQLELNSVSIQEQFPQYGIAKAVDTLINTCGTKLKATAYETGYTMEQQQKRVQDGPAGSELSDMCRFRLTSEYEKRRDDFMVGSSEKDARKGATKSDGPIKTLAYQPLSWRSMELIPDNVQVNVRLTRAKDRQLFIGPQAYDNAPVNFLHKHQLMVDGFAALSPQLMLVRAEAFIKLDVLSGISDSSMLKHLAAGNDIKLNRHMIRQQLLRCEPGAQSFQFTNILPGPKPSLVVMQFVNNEFALATHNDNTKFGLASMGKPEVRNFTDALHAKKRFQLTDLQITVGGTQYPFRRYQAELTSGEARPRIGAADPDLDALPNAGDISEYTNAQQLYEQYRLACKNPEDPAMTFEEWAENPLFVFQTEAAPESGAMDPIIALTSIEVRAVANIPLQSVHQLVVTTYTPDIISIDQGRRVIE